MGMYVSIDPGLDGAIAAVSDTGAVLKLVDTPTTTIQSGKKNKRIYIASEMVRILESVHVEGVHVAIEKQFPFRGQGISSTFSTAFGYGLWTGILSALKLPFTVVTSQRWKKAMMDGMGKEKAASCVRAQQLYPDAELFTERGRALDGRGDALLIATYLKNNTRP